MTNYQKDKKGVNAIFALLCIIKGLIIVLSIGLPYIIRLFTKGNKPAEEMLFGYDNLVGLIFELAYAGICILVPLLIYYGLRDKKEAKDELLLRRPTLLQMGVTIGYTSVFTMAVSFVANLILVLILMLFGKELPTSTTSMPSNIWLIPIFLLTLAIFPAFTEEFIVRGAMMGKLKKYGLTFSIFVSSIAFSLLHNTIVQLPFALAAGLVIGYCTIKFQSIWVGVIAHFMINLSSGIIQIIYSLCSEEVGTILVLLYMLLAASFSIGLTIAGLIIYGIKIPKHLHARKEDTHGRWQLIFSSPFLYVFLVLFFVMFGVNIASLQ